MGLDTDFNQAPYFDDFSEDKNFHRILFKPGVAVQARELTQLQTILQNQVERFGDNILREGTIISGCNFKDIRKVGYVKILDTQTNGQPVSVSSYDQMLAVGVTTGVQGRIIAVDTGLESQSPDLSTLYIKYTVTGSSEEKVFSTTENVQIQNPDTLEVIGTVTVAGSIEGSVAIGNSYGVKVGEGVIYQKGHFVRVDEQLTIISKYTNEPDGLVVGFRTDESLVNSFADTSLLDNAAGSNNENAPGADRLKLTPVLVVLTLAEAAADEDFFAIQEYAGGRLIRRNRTTQYEGILQELRERTRDESGSYTVKDFRLRIQESDLDANNVTLEIGRGKAYVEGRKVQLLNNLPIEIPKATEFETEEGYSRSTNIGNYVLVDELAGNFDTHTAGLVYLFDTPFGDVTANGTPTANTALAIGTARIRSLTLDEGTPGTAAAQYRAYLFDVNMNSGETFSDVQGIHYAGTGANDAGTADTVSTTLFETGFKVAVFPMGASAVKAVPASGQSLDFVYRTVNKSLTISATGVLEIDLSSGAWPYGDGALNATQLEEILVVSAENNSPYILGRHVDLSGASAVVAGTTLTISGLSTPTSGTCDVIAHYNVKETTALPTAKELKTVYIKIDALTNADHANNKYGLGLPDVFRIKNIWAGSTYANTNTEVSNQFRLISGQRQTHYTHAFLRRRSGYTITGGVNDKILVEAEVFQSNDTGSYGTGIFTVSSYPIDDANTANTSAITTQEIPSFTYGNGITINLRDAVDFRPQVANTINYEESVAVAIANNDAAFINPNTSVDFGTSDLLLVSPNKEFESDFEFYLGRKDVVFIGSDGAFEVLQGDADEVPARPTDPNKAMVLADLDIPPFPSLPKRVADQADRPEYGIKMKLRENRRYTMRDIGDIDSRVKRLEYYTALNALETKTKDLIVTDANGLDRFKNGIFVDGFRNFRIADVKADGFSAAIDASEKSLVPRFKAYPLNLKQIGGDATVTKDTAFIPTSSEFTLIDQPYATKSRSCVTDFYKYSGQMVMDPPYDSFYDTTRAPNLELEVDLTDAFVEYTEALSEFVPLSRTDRSVTENISGSLTVNGAQEIRTTTRTVTTDTTTTSLEITEGEGSTQSTVGDFVTDIRMNPFLRPQRVRFFATGLRPNTRHYVYFDEVSVDQYVRPAEMDPNSDDLENMIPTGRRGSVLRTDANGEVAGIFHIPGETFFAGDRVLIIADVSATTELDDASSSASFTYSAFNFSVERQSITMSTRIPQFATDVRNTRTTQTFVSTRIERRFEGGGGGGDAGGDPIAQTFFIDPDMTSDEIVMVNELDLFFKEKSTSVGVTVEIRETENGFPSENVVPLSSVYLRPGQVNASGNNSTLTATTITFKTPIALKKGEEYCFVVKPDANSPDYRIWVAETGQADFETGLAVVSDANPGVLFTSTNNSAWTPYQNENIRYVMRANKFAASATVRLGVKNNEFLTISNTSGNFEENERVFILAANATGTITTNTESKTITGTGLDIFQAGDYIGYHANSSVVDLLRVKTAVSNTEIETFGKPLVANSSANFFKTVKGNVVLFDRNDPGQMHLERSSAAPGTTDIFEAGDKLIGENSQATCDIDSVDQLELSYFQPHIYRTNSSKTKTSLEIQTARDVNQVNITEYQGRKVPFNRETYLVETSAYIPSKSLQSADNAQFRLDCVMENKANAANRFATPIIDHKISNVTVYANQINNLLISGDLDEAKAGGDGPATTKYISREIELAEGFDADDMSLFITGYRPGGTEISVYVRFQNEVDESNPADLAWTKLTIKPESEVRSSSKNRNDFKEFEFFIPSSSLVNLDDGGQAGLVNDILTYKSEGGVVYSKYRKFTVKVVLTSNKHNVVPRVRDIRAIALT